MRVTPEMMEASCARPGDTESADAAFDRVMAEAARADVFETVLQLYGPPSPDLPTLADIVPIATARKPRSRNWLAAEIEQRRMRMVFHYSTPPYAEFWEGDRCLGRDPMPTTILLDDDRALFAMPLEAPGPNCLDAMSAALGLTDAERLEFGCRREDAKALHEAKAAEVQRELEKGAPMPPLEKP